MERDLEEQKVSHMFSLQLLTFLVCLCEKNMFFLTFQKIKIKISIELPYLVRWKAIRIIV